TQGARLGLRAFDVRWRRTASGLSAPTQVTSARDGRDRLFVVQKGGQVKIVRDGNVVNRPYLAIGGRVDPVGEGGLLSVAFSPTFRQDGLLWVTFSRQIDGDLVVARLRASGPHADHVRAKTLRPIMRIEHSSEENHFGGQLAFGPGKRLFIGTGDGGSFGDPHNNAGNRGSLLGKVLRINPFKHCKGRGYCIPDGNPFKGKRGRDEIWLMGLRNPWRFSFDKRTNRLWIGDVGQDRFEEIDRVSPRPRRIHLGWSCREGRRIYNASRCRRSVRYLGPKVVVRQPIAQSIVGGFVYRGRRYDRQIGGAYVFGDYVTRRIWLFRPGAGKVAQEARIGGGLTSFGLNDRGEIYAVTIDGSLWRMRVVRG
ncbi:MAG TPA: PQQ-dependent sugar dehydrogenase, partial [Actinomycetes bacterium]|nr:PQQ-dependent sugar dehydrogenase [Actinomycetes bacterium]